MQIAQHWSLLKSLPLCLLLLSAACGDASTSQPQMSGSSGAGGASSSSSGGSTSSSTGSSGGTGGAGGASPSCMPLPACDAAPPDPGPQIAWNNGSPTGKANHRGRDLFLNPGDPQWVIAKFAYGIEPQNVLTFDNDLEDEQVDIWLLRDCGTQWEKLGSVNTTNDDIFGNGPHATVEGVKDDGGRVYFEIPADKKLDIGRHRFRLVARGDLSFTELFIEVVKPGTPTFVSDIDGTLTESEFIEFEALLAGELPPVHPDAAKAFQLLVDRGYRPQYLTARPDWLGARTRETMDFYGFPPGIIHTTTGDTGALGGAAVEYKSGELAVMKGRGILPTFGFGNTDSDAEAYDTAPISPKSNRFYYQYDDTAFGGRRIESYTELLSEFGQLPEATCPQ